MLASLIGLIVFVLAVRGIIWCARTFWQWLGRGKPARGASECAALSDESREAVEVLEAIRAANRLGNSPLHLTRDQLRQLKAAEAAVRSDFVDHLTIGWYQVVMIFFIGSVGGLLLEEVWMFATMGVTESRVGLVWGPFSPLYGVGAVLLTLATFQLRRRHASMLVVFLVSMVIGGVLEQGTGWAMETFMGAVSWDYIAGGVPGAITKWVAVPFLFFWGLLGTCWYRFIMPSLLWWLGVPTTRRKVVFVSLLAAYLAADIFMTAACFDRRAERLAGIPPHGAFERWVDTHYTDQFMADRFENMVITNTGDAITGNAQA
ncbi:putative ABC transporter permease [Atopobiaceae bacterium 24-176]